ncbi:MAG: hypothetical protein IJ461_06690 [Clostridia bacterium]|nr:hypothetical protein [Clostridia bacterium]
MMLILKGENEVYGVAYDTTSTSSDSNAYGIVCANLLITGEGTLKVDTADVDGNTYGIKSSSGVTIESGTIQITAGDSINISRGWTQVSYGIYADTAVALGGSSSSPVVRVTAGDSYGESCAIYGDAGISIRSGDVTASAGYANRGYADGLLSDRSTIYIEGGKVTASSEGSYGGMSTGICANVLEITGGEVRATGGLPKQGNEQSAGIYVNYDINISGGTVYGTGLKNMGDVCFGINSWRGDITIGGNAVVYAVGGPASYSVGLSAERRYNGSTYAGGDIIIRDNAKVYASISDDGPARVYSYGMFVGGNLLIEGSPYVEAVGGKVSEDWITGLIFNPPREKRSFGIYLADAIYDGTNTNYVEGGHKDTTERHTFHITGGTVIAKTVETKNGTIKYADEDRGEFEVFHRSYAVVLYDADKIAFANTTQPNETWYQWKIEAADAFTRSTNTAYPDADKWQSATQYFHVEPIEEPQYKPVTFKVINGTWVDSSAEDITVQVELVEGSGNLTAYIPAGMQPNSGYQGGAWDLIPPSVVTGTEAVTYTYTFTAIPPVYKQVTFKVVNGVWSDGTTKDKVVMIELPSPDGTAALNVPAGMQPNSGYQGGAWDITPPSSVSGTEAVVYTFAFEPVLFPFDPEIDFPETGDGSTLGLWGMMLLGSGWGIARVTVGQRKKK